MGFSTGEGSTVEKPGAEILFTRHSAVKYHLNLDSLIKRNRKAISTLTPCKKYAILEKHRTGLHLCGGPLWARSKENRT